MCPQPFFGILCYIYLPPSLIVMAFEGNASASGGFDPPGRYFMQRAAAVSEPGPEPTPSLRPEESDDGRVSDPGNPAPITSPVAPGLGFIVASPTYASSVQSPATNPGSWATVGDVSTGSELVDQLSRLRPDTRDRIVHLCMRMGTPSGPKASASSFPPASPAPAKPKSSFPPASPAPAEPKVHAPPTPLDELGFPLAVSPDAVAPKAQAKNSSFPPARPTVVYPPPCLVQCPTPGCFNQFGRPVYGRGHRNHFCRVCHRLRG